MGELTQEIVKEFLDYDPENGKLTWKYRDLKWFNGNERICNSWNTRCSGKEAFKNLHKLKHFQGKIFHKSYKAHRIIWLWMTGKWPVEIDHDDGNPSNNKWENLFESDRTKNNRNRGKPKNNTSGVLGVRKRHFKAKYEAFITIGRKQEHLGSYENIEDAKAARLLANEKYNFNKNHGREICS